MSQNTERAALLALLRAVEDHGYGSRQYVVALERAKLVAGGQKMPVGREYQRHYRKVRSQPGIEARA